MLTLDHISMEFSSRPVLDDITFLINRKERIALVGKNGAGKTTLLRLIAGEYQPTFGRISRETDMTIGYLPQAIKEYKTSYEPGETVLIRFCTMDQGMYDFWNTFQELTGVSFFLTFPNNFDNLPSNMQGAYGYWAGYGTSAYELTIPED